MQAPTTSRECQRSLPEMQPVENQEPKFLSKALAKLSAKLISHVSIDSKSIQAVQDAAQDRSIAYVMPSASILDYLLLRALTFKNRLPEARLANSIPLFLCH